MVTINVEACAKGFSCLRRIISKGKPIGPLNPKLYHSVPKSTEGLKYALPKQKGKVLLEKIPKTKINKEQNLSVLNIPHEAREYSFAKIGKIEDPSYSQEIFSFYNKDGNIINRFIRESKKNDIFVEYSPWNCVVDEEFSINAFKTRQITKMSVNKNKAKQNIQVYKGFQITKDNAIPFMPLNNKNARIISEELQCIRNNAPRFDLVKDSYIKRHYYKGFRLDKGEIIERAPNEIFKPKPDKIEYRSIKRFYGKSQEVPEHISMKTHYLSNNFGERVIDKSGADLYLKKEAKDVKLINLESYNSDSYARIENNPFAAYMYLSPKTKGKYLQRFFAKRKGILPLNVKTYVNSKEVTQNAAAHFDPSNCQVHTKNVYITPSTIAHETEHAFQHALAGRYYLVECPGYMDFLADYTAKKGAKLLGKCPENLMAEAKVYINGIHSYPRTSKTEILRNNPDYWFNELEVGARNEEQKWVQYDRLPHTTMMNKVNF